MRRALLAVVALAWPVAAAASAAARHDVTVGDNRFEPSDLAIATGDTVRWTNTGLRQHSVTFRSGGSDDLLPTESTETTFAQPGTYRYFCRFHEFEMEGTVVARGASTPTTRSTTTTTEPPAGSARTGPPDSSTTTSSTTTTVPGDDGTTTTTTVPGSAAGGASNSSDDSGANVDGPAAVAALLLLAAGGAAFMITRTSLP